jgi:phosphotransferase system HPr-like phosphotransfer protein
MREILSTNIKIQTKYCTKITLDIFHVAKQFEGNTFIYSNHKTIDAANLPKLVSFLLTLEPKTTINVIIEGSNVKNHLEKILTLLTKPSEYMKELPNNVLIASKKYSI